VPPPVLAVPPPVLAAPPPVLAVPPPVLAVPPPVLPPAGLEPHASKQATDAMMMALTNPPTALYVDFLLGLHR
jgi:hypothetical protein